MTWSLKNTLLTAHNHNIHLLEPVAVGIYHWQVDRIVVFQ
jgi:hypothetical protein